MAENKLSYAQIQALLRYAVGIGSEGPTPGLGLAGWVNKDGSGQFDTSGNAINADDIKKNSGYSAGSLQTDFGQRHSGAYLTPFDNFMVAFFASLSASTLSQDQLNDITSKLQKTGSAFKADPSLMLDATEFNALKSFLQSSEGITAPNNLDQDILNAETSFGVAAADLVAQNGGDLTTQEMAATVNMKLAVEAHHDLTVFPLAVGPIRPRQALEIVPNFEPSVGSREMENWVSFAWN